MIILGQTATQQKRQRGQRMIIADDYFGSNRNLIVNIVCFLSIIADDYFGSNRNNAIRSTIANYIIADDYFGSNRNSIPLFPRC